MENEIQQHSLCFAGESDFGPLFKMECPECGYELVIGGFAGIGHMCRCSRVWRLEVFAVGEKTPPNVKDEPRRSEA